MRVVVIGAGVGGLATAVRLAAAGHAVTVLEAGAAPGGKCARIERDGFGWDAGPSLLTMPWVFEALFAETGAPLAEELELLPVEPVTRYRFADGSGFDLSADLERSRAALDAWRPGAGDEWAAFMRTCERMWRASAGVLAGPAPWPPRRPRAGDPRPSPLDLARVQPWRTLRALARAHTADPRLQMVIERFATYAGADPRRAPAALAVAGYVEHAWGAWYPRGGLYALVGRSPGAWRHAAARCGSARARSGSRWRAGARPAWSSPAASTSPRTPWSRRSTRRPCTGSSSAGRSPCASAASPASRSCSACAAGRPASPTTR